MDRNTAEKSKYNWIKVGALFLGIYLFFRYVFSLVAPFVIAFLLISMLYPGLQKLQNRVPIKKKYLATILMITFLILLSALGWLLFNTCADKIDSFPKLYTKVEQQTQSFFHTCCNHLDGVFGCNGAQLEQNISAQIDHMTGVLKTQALPQMVSSSYACVKSILSAFAFVIITVIAIFLFEKDYTSILSILQETPQGKMIWSVVQGVLSYIGTFLRAQGVILLAISILCVVVLCIAGIEGAVLLGIFAGLFDVLPFIGTGIVLVPSALWQLMSGNYGRMTVCFLLYGGCAFLRQWLEPKLIGKQMGIPPVFLLLFIYAGVKLFGISGIIKGPLSLVIINETLQKMKR